MLCFIIYLSSYLVLLVSGHENKTSNQLVMNIDYTDNGTFILNYNLTTNYSYFLTFRLFEHEQIRFGLFSPTYRYQHSSLEIVYRYNSSRETSYLIIICVHFIYHLTDIDIQCEDIRLWKNRRNKSDRKYLPSYKPLFIPMMYVLSILVLLPVIIQHRRQKRSPSVKSQKQQLRRLSLTISPSNLNILSEITETRIVNLEKTSIQIELVSVPSKKTILDGNTSTIYQEIRSCE